tara:strand:+ start:18 stop:434 length:417 start_codon:yes stop_codon:yes gene_type:complete
MKSFKFVNKQQAKTYSIFTIISVILAIFIFSNLDTFINKHVAYLLVTILSFISIMVSVKKAGKEFVEIVIENESVKFYYFNKMKAPFIISKREISISLENDKLEFKNLKSGEFIGRVYKNRIEEVAKWDDLLACIRSS